MYKITIQSTVKDNKNFVLPSPRYCLTKKQTKKLAKLYIEKMGWDIFIEKFTYLYDGIFCWSALATESIYPKKEEK